MADIWCPPFAFLYPIKCTNQPRFYLLAGDARSTYPVAGVIPRGRQVMPCGPVRHLSVVRQFIGHWVWDRRKRLETSTLHREKSALDPASRAPHPAVRRKWGGDKTGGRADLFAGAGGNCGFTSLGNPQSWAPGFCSLSPSAHALIDYAKSSIETRCKGSSCAWR